MKVTIKWVDLLDGIIKTLLWVLIAFNSFIERYDVALVYAVVLIAWNLSDIAINTRKNNE